MKQWREEARRLKDIPRLKETMDENIARSPKYYRKRMKLLDDFFAQQQAPVDIAFVLYGALSDAHHLAYHLEGNNVLFYRPKTSHRRYVESAFLEGKMYPERTLLIWDSDMVTGNAMTETANFFREAGYDRARTYGYLDEGCKWRQYGTPELMQIDKILRKSLWNRVREFLS